MKITDKQNYVLQNLHRIEIITEPSKLRYMIDGSNCRYQIVGLAARGIVSWAGQGRPRKIAHPTGITGPRWQRPQ